MSIAVMKQALEALEHEANKGNDNAYQCERDALRTAIEQAEKQEPVAWMYDFLSDNRDEVIRDWVTQSQDDITRENGFNVRPLYAAPRQWIGLTEIEICDIEVDELPSASSETFSFARAIEARLKEKNSV